MTSKYRSAYYKYRPEYRYGVDLSVRLRGSEKYGTMNVVSNLLIALRYKYETELRESE